MAREPGWQQEGVDCKEMNPAQTTTFKFNKLAAETQQQLHRCYHAKKTYFEQFAVGLQFSTDEIQLYLPIMIETNLCQNCENNQASEYKETEQENCNKIDVYFHEINAYITQYHANVMQSYKQQCDHHFRTHKQSALQIQLKPMKQELDEILLDCYEIIDSQQPNPPLIKITNGDVGGLVIEILDKDKAPNDKYEIVINDTIRKEYINGDNKQQYIEIMDDIEPLTIYQIVCRRYIDTKQRWSKYCASINIVTDVKFSWSKRYRGSNAKLSNLARDVYCKSHKGSCCIATDKDISSTKYKHVLFSFTMTSLGHLSYCGFVEYANTDAFEQNMRPFWDDLVVKNANSYCLGFCDGSNTMQRWINGSKKGKSKWTKDLKLQNGEKIHAGDVLLFDVNFDRMACDVYINEKSEEHKIYAANVEQNTFANIPNHIIPVYSHENNPYIVAHSNVIIKMERYVLQS